MPVSLNSSVVESREQRLGSIVSWEGSASELSKASGYSRGDCSGCPSGGKRLCEQELNLPFTQGMSCSEMMVECQAGHIRDAVLVEHSPIGCSAGQVAYNSKYRNALKMRGIPVENTHWLCTNLTEKDMVYGGVEKLERTLHDAWERHHPQAIFIATSCATGIIGDDVDGTARKVQEEIGIPVVPLYCEGFKSHHWSTGFDSTQHGILRQIVRRDPVKKQEDLVNVINLWGSDVFRPMLAEFGLRVNYVVDLATVEDLAQMSEAAATIGFCNTLSSYLATALEEEFGVPQVKAPQPYGIGATDAWLREIGRVTHREERVEAYIAKEHARIAPGLEALRQKLTGVKGFSATGSAYSHGLIAVMRELGVQVDGTLVFHHDPIYDSRDPALDSLAQLVDTHGDVKFFSVANRQQYLLPALLRRVNPDFLLIRHNGLAPLASRLGIPAIPLGDEHHPLGYQGLLNMGESIVGILARRKFHQDLAEHVKLPYSKWWLSQDDPFVLARDPSAGPAKKTAKKRQNKPKSVKEAA